MLRLFVRIAPKSLSWRIFRPHRWAIIGLVVGLAATSTIAATLLQNGSDQEILVYGVRRESRSSGQTGQTTVIRPQDGSRFDALTHLRRDSAMTPYESGKISATGAALPRIRGQNEKLTDVYVEDFLLQNPYGGLPLMDHLDLRAFGILEVYQGLSPVEIPGISPVGALKYRFAPTGTAPMRAGVQIGKPYGFSLWGLGVQTISGSPEKAPLPESSNGCISWQAPPHLPASGGSFKSRIFFRHHQSDGHYRYYSDEGTPYNQDDDRITTRTNNDQRSMQVMPYFDWSCGPWRVKILSWWATQNSGLPTGSAKVTSNSRETTNHQLMSVALERTFGTEASTLAPSSLGEPLKGSVGPLRLSLNLSQSLDESETEDPGRRFLILADSSRLKITNRRLSGKADQAVNLGLLGGEWFFQGENAQALLSQRLGERQNASSDLKRQSSALSFGLRLFSTYVPPLTVEAKTAWRGHQSRATESTSKSGASLEGEASSQIEAPQRGLSTAWSTDAGHVYMQWAKGTRLPSLFEEFGNGSSVQPNKSLKPEQLVHREVGGSLKIPHLASWLTKAKLPASSDEVSLAIYEDLTTDKIIFIPIYANASKALNVRKTQIRGIDLKSDLTLFQHQKYATHLYFSLSRILAHDTTRSLSKVVAGIPAKVAVAEWIQTTPWTTLRWTSRYRSEIYRDMANDIVIPSTLLHDASLDTALKMQTKSRLKLGLMIRNIFDLVAVPIAAKDGSSTKGRTGLSDFAGAPLPGRQWTLSATAEF